MTNVDPNASSHSTNVSRLRQAPGGSANENGKAETIKTGGRWRPDRCGRIALILQGGGALGAYQAGVYEALHERDIEPDWVTGVSIGAINASLIAGNVRENRLERLREFWQRVTDRPVWGFTPDGDIFRQMRIAASSMLTMTWGQPGFFEPQPMSPWLSAAGAATATSYYNTAPLKQTLGELVDFSLINTKTTRFAVGAVEVSSGNFAYFDNDKDTITAEHIMASGALPPALPMVKIGSKYYWDGGIVSNTPLQHLLDNEGQTNTLIFQVDLFSARGDLPRSMEDVLGRQKDIMYSSRTRYNTDMYRKLREWKDHLARALAKLPPSDLTEEERRLKDELSKLPDLTILQLIYQQKSYEGQTRDYDFSRASMEEHWQAGLEDTRRTLTHREWLELPKHGSTIVVHDVHREQEG